MFCFEQMSLYSTPNKLVIAPGAGAKLKSDVVLVVYRGTGQICVDPSDRHLPLPSNIPNKKKTIYGVVGYAEVPQCGPLLAVITRKIRQGDLPGDHTVWRLDAIEVRK